MAEVYHRVPYATKFLCREAFESATCRAPISTDILRPIGGNLAALAVSKLPVGQTTAVIGQLTGEKLPRATPDREAPRQGRRAQKERQQMEMSQSLGARATSAGITVKGGHGAFHVGNRYAWNTASSLEGWPKVVTAKRVNYPRFFLPFLGHIKWTAESMGKITISGVKERPGFERLCRLV